MHKRKKIILSSAALGVVAASAIAWGVNENIGREASAEPDSRYDRPWRQGHRGPMHRLGRHLDLSDEQRENIAAIMRQARDEGELLGSQLADLRGEVTSMIRNNEYDEDEARIRVENASPLFVDLTLLGIRTMSQVYSELTPAQRIRADELLEKRKRGRFGRGGFWGSGF